jgi:glycoprotein 6-alpha-L-fucosyltransferase
LTIVVALYTILTVISRSPSPPIERKLVEKIPFVASQRVGDLKKQLEKKEEKKEDPLVEVQHIAKRWRNLPSTKRPPKIGFDSRPPLNKRTFEDQALVAMWRKLDKETREKNQDNNKARPKSAEEIARVWTESMKKFDDRMKVIKQYDSGLLQHIQNIRSDLLAEIASTQNPEDCSKAKYLYVENDKNTYGFGAQLHHFIYTLIVGYASGRAIIIEKGNFKYAASMAEWCNNDTTIECFFQPLGKCTHYISDDRGKQAPLWIPGDEDNNEQVLRLRCRSSIEYRQWIPDELAIEVAKFHENPHLWWVGHFTHYFLRPSDQLLKGLTQMRKVIGYSNPIMGMHVRGKEKGTEAPVHPLAQYMPYVMYPKIYLATDDQDNVNEADRRTNYTWIMSKDPDTGRLSGVGARHSQNAILNLLYDVYFLAESDFFIGTDSSQISRAVYELMQVRHPDATRLGVSLDTILVDKKFEFYWFLI